MVVDEEKTSVPQSQGPWTDIAFHTLGWKAFQDLCAHVCEDVLNLPVEIYREAQDGGQDAVFVSKSDGAQTTTTVQCKFSSDASKLLRPADIKKEEDHVSQLVQAGQADTYVLMTSMRVSAPVAVAIKSRLRSLGVRRAHVFGKEYLTRVIKSSGRLRALVPRIYGLGDLSTILDERKAAQTRALLGHMLPTLRTYVPTKPHVKAVRALSKHKIVLLVGDPATGKSTIAAVLSTIAADRPDHRVFKADGPHELIQNWNPHEGGAFYWVDDAFGPNQMREDYVDAWISIMGKVEAAMAARNTFVLTSRRHIYEAAKRKLGTRNHPLFRNSQAIVEVGDLTVDEKCQILYNHIKSGDQPHRWKNQIKNELRTLANEPTLTPEIARQLGDSSFTSRVPATKDHLLSFVRRNRAFLLQTIRELSKQHRAALALIFLHRGHMPISGPLPQMQELIIRHYDVDREALSDAVIQLKDSFIVERTENDRKEWMFKHPTLSDALSVTLSEADGMRELYLRGAKIDTILSDTLCDQMEPIENAVIIPPTLDKLLIERVLETEDDSGYLNRIMFGFLERRASEHVFREVIVSNPQILERMAHASYYTANDPKVLTYARALALGLLSSDLREKIIKRLEEALFDELDTSILDEEATLSLFYPRQLLSLVPKVKERLLPKLEGQIDETDKSPDYELSAEENFEDIQSRMQGLDRFFDGAEESTLEALANVQTALDEAMQSVKEKLERREEEEAREESYWREYDGAGRSTPQVDIVRSEREATSARSMFSDVDE